MNLLVIAVYKCTKFNYSLFVEGRYEDLRMSLKLTSVIKFDIQTICFTSWISHNLSARKRIDCSFNYDIARVHFVVVVIVHGLNLIPFLID